MDSSRFRLTPPDPSTVKPEDYDAPVIRAASVLMLQEHNDQLNVFVQHRVSSMDFAAGAAVFPGGRSEPLDDEVRWGSDYDELLDAHAYTWQNTSLGSQDPEAARLGASSIMHTAIREVEEETGTRLVPEQLKPWENLVTPVGYPKRFDTFFFVANVEDSIDAEHHTSEATHSRWWVAQELLDAVFADEVRMMLPTRMLLDEVIRFGSIKNIFARNHQVKTEVKLDDPSRVAHLLKPGESYDK